MNNTRFFRSIAVFIVCLEVFSLALNPTNNNTHQNPNSPMTLSNVLESVTYPVRISVAPDGTEGNNASSFSLRANGDYAGHYTSDDGNLIVFSSHASNLIPGDTNGVSDIFLRNLSTNQTERISTGINNSQANNNSGYPSITPDGRYIVFQSYASNLVPGDTQMCYYWSGALNCPDIFVYDRVNKTTSLVSKSSSGQQSNADNEFPQISNDGRYIAFESTANNLVENDTNKSYDVFVHDLSTKQTKRVSIASDGTQANDQSHLSSISNDGSLIAFGSLATNMVVNDTNNVRDVFVRDQINETTVRVNVADDGSQADSTQYITWGVMSSNGRFIFFVTDANNITGKYSKSCLFVRDLEAKITTLLNITCAAPSSPFTPLQISSDGQSVLFRSTLNGTDPQDNNSKDDVYLYNRITDKLTWVSKSFDNLQGNNYSLYGSMSENGQHVVFSSLASNLVQNDLNGSEDVFYRAIGNPTLTPLIIIPGIGGSKLWNSDGEQWPRLDYLPCSPSDSELENLSLDTAGKVDVHKLVTVGEIIRKETPLCLGKSIPSAGEEDFYDTTINAFTNAGYHLGTLSNYQQGDNLFIFPYDWRKDVEGVGKDLLTFIDAVRGKTGASKVDLFAHSMGGLVARVALTQTDSDGKIRKVITLGTPVLGAPKALGMLEYKSPCFVEPALKVICPINPTTLQNIVINFPSVYEILPSPRYDRTEHVAPLLINWDLNGDGTIDGPQNYADWSSIISLHRNSMLLNRSKAFHDTYDNVAPIDPLVQYVAIVGDG